MTTTVRLWRRAPAWRHLIVGACVCTALAIMFAPASRAPGSSPGASAVMIPPIPTGPASYQAPAGAQSYGASQANTVLQPVAPVAPTIQPSRTLRAAELPDSLQHGPEEFGVYRGDERARIKPSGPPVRQEQRQDD